MKQKILPIDQQQNHKIMVVIGFVAALGGLVALLGYIDRKRDEAMDRSIKQLDKDIKELQYLKLAKSV